MDLVAYTSGLHVLFLPLHVTFLQLQICYDVFRKEDFINASKTGYVLVLVLLKLLVKPVPSVNSGYVFFSFFLLNFI